MLHDSERVVGVRLTGIGTDRILEQTPRHINASILRLQSGQAMEEVGIVRAAANAGLEDLAGPGNIALFRLHPGESPEYPGVLGGCLQKLDEDLLGQPAVACLIGVLCLLIHLLHLEVGKFGGAEIERFCQLGEVLFGRDGTGSGAFDDVVLALIIVIFGFYPGAILGFPQCLSSVEEILHVITRWSRRSRRSRP